MQHLIRSCAFSLLLVPLAGTQVVGQVFQVDRDWNYPAGLIQFHEDGSIVPTKFEASLNAALDADQFIYESKEQGQVKGGVWKVGSNPRDAANITDGDPETFWKPDPNDPLEDWWIEINLGRAVPTNLIRLRFPDQEDAKPLGLFRLVASDGVRQATGLDFFFFDLVFIAGRAIVLGCVACIPNPLRAGTAYSCCFTLLFIFSINLLLD